MEFKKDQISIDLINKIKKEWKLNSNIKEIEDIEKKTEDFFKKYPQETSKNKKTSHQEASLKSGEQSNIKTNPAPESKNKKIQKPEIPF